jgi:RimJ/RimL family protein N-acetyltransferase
MTDGKLHVPLVDQELVLQPLAERHREGLRAACAEDDDIWEIYPASFRDDHFDPNFNAMLGRPERQSYAIFSGDDLVGMTAWIDDNPALGTAEIGGSYLVPRMRGTGFNGRLKKLMLDHAFGCGYRRVVFKVDQINRRSQAAVMKLGCTKEGVLRQDRITWTGRIRTTIVFSILADEWLNR